MVLEFHGDEKGHTIEECIKFKQLLQKVMDKQLIQIGFNDEENQLNAIEGSDKVNGIQFSLFSLNTLVIHYNKNSFSPPPQTPTSRVLEPIRIQVPMPFPYKMNNEVPWNYNY